MSNIQLIPGVSFSGSGQEKIYPDKMMNDGTLIVMDAKDVTAYPPQAAPAAGVTTWDNLVLGGSDASFVGSVGWSAGGFDFVNGSGEYIQLPTITKLAAGVTGALFIYWLKGGTQVATTGTAGVAGLADSVSAGGGQMHLEFAQSVGTMAAKYNGSTGISGGSHTPVAGTTYQYGMSVQLIDGVLVFKSFRNGVLTGTTTSVLTMMPVPATQPAIRIGALGAGLQNSWVGKCYRTVYDPLTVVTDPLTIVAADYAAWATRLA